MDEGQRRLAFLDRSLNPGRFRRLETIGVREGWRCLDVGAGGGTICESRRAWGCGRPNEKRLRAARKGRDMNCATALLMTGATACALMSAHPPAAPEPGPLLPSAHFLARSAPP